MIHLLIRFRWLFAGSVLMLALVTAPYLEKALVPNNALTVWFLEEDSLLVDYRKFQQQFGNDEMIAVMVHQPNGWVEPEGRRILEQLTERLARVEGIANVSSPVNALDLQVVSGTVEPIHVWSNPTILVGDKRSAAATRFIDSTGTYCMLYLQMATMHDIDLKRDAIVAAVRQATEETVESKNIFLGGLGVVYAGLNEITKNDFGLFVGLSYLVMFFIIYWLFRSILLVLVALSGVFVATVLTLELYGFLGYQVNMLTMTIPTIIIILAILDVLHIIHDYQLFLAQNGGDRMKAMESSFRKVWLPCLFTTLTTMGGLISFVFSPMAVLREFGWFSSMGVALALVCSFILAAAALPHVRPGKESLLEKPVFRNVLFRVGEHQRRRPALYLAVIVMITVIAMILVFRIEVDTYTIKYLPDNHRVVTDHEKIKAVWGDYLGLEFTIHPMEGVGVGDVRLLHAMSEFSRKAEALPEVRGSLGLHLAAARIPDPSQVNTQNPPSGDLDMRLLASVVPGYIDSSHESLRMTLVGSMMSAKNLDRLLHDLGEISSQTFEGLAVVKPSGYPPLYTRIIDYVTTSQIQSFYLAVATVFGMMILLLRSVRFALISLVPNLFPVLFLFATMGLFGLTLDIATATTAAIVLGFSIDDTIHFMVEYRRNRASHMDADNALRNTITHTGGAMIINSMILFLGYAVLLFASVKTVYYFGLLTMIAIVGGIVSELILLPMLIRYFDKPDPKGV